MVVEAGSAGLAWLRTLPPGAWVEEAACADGGLDPDVRAAFTWEVLDEAAVRAVCASCTVRVPCGVYGAQAKAWGVWGGVLLWNGREREPARRAG